ncbi:MAG: hypothetical protein JSV03_16875 [Planctomycetota bacterium]|nr:MAG: hypothetical protein JSV03_16875 [Planctomycetota bacterium]
MMKFCWILTLMIVSSSLANSSVRPLFDAIREVETGGHSDPTNAKGDGGRSLGPYQITWAYWKDSALPGRYRMVRQKAYAERVMTAYWRRYCPHALTRHDFQTLARIHNGGPKGATSINTIAYWRRVRQKLSWFAPSSTRYNRK